MNYNDRLNYGTVRMLDVECYKNLFVICLDNPQQYFFSPQEMLKHLSETYSEDNPCTLVTFNGQAYDFPLMQEAYKYFMRPITDEVVFNQVWAEIKAFSDQLIQEEKAFRERLGLPAGVRHIDVKAVCPVMTSLKLLGARLGCESIQDLPYPHDSMLTQAQQVEVVKYCLHDLEITRMVWEDRKRAINLREWHQKNLSDAQISERQMVPERRRSKNVVPLKVEVFGHEFEVNQSNGSPIDPGLPDQVIDGVTYQVGLGGLHSADRPCVIDLRERDDMVMLGVDVTGFYPSLICGPLSHTMDEEQLRIYKEVRANRTASKKRAGQLKEMIESGDTSESTRKEYEDQSTRDEMGKLMTNSYFGKTGSCYSPAYNPKAMLSVTLLGQVYLLKLIRMMVSDKSKGIKVLSANTDGIECIMPTESVGHFRAVCKQWEAETTMGLEEERTFFVARRDVNSYFMLLDSKKKPVKTKGIFEPASIKKSLAFEIINEAVMASFGIGRKGEIPPVDVAAYINAAATNPEQFQKFLAVRTVNGGAILNPTYEVRDDWEPVEPKKWVAKSTGKKATRVSRPAPYEVFMGGEPVGRVIRWYIGVQGQNVYTPKGGKVPLTDNAVLVQDLSKRSTTPIDVNWYIHRAEKLRNALLSGDSFNDEE